MTIIGLLTEMNNQYLVVLAMLIGVLVEVIKSTKLVASSYLPIVTGSLGLVIGGLVGLSADQNILQSSLNGLVVSLIAMGGFDTLKVLWHLPKWFA